MALTRAFLEALDDGELLSRVHGVGERFDGVDITFRRCAPSEWTRAANGTPYVDSWPRDPGHVTAYWRLRVVAFENERAEYRITVYGETFRAAAIALLERV